MGERNLVYFSGTDDTGKLPGYSCVRVPAAPGMGNSALIRLARLLLKFSDGLPIP